MTDGEIIEKARLEAVIAQSVAAIECEGCGEQVVGLHFCGCTFVNEPSAGFYVGEFKNE
jgi:hypothetical protein